MGSALLLSKLSYMFYFYNLCSKREDVYRVVKAVISKGDWMNSEAKRFAQFLVWMNIQFFCELLYHGITNYTFWSHLQGLSCLILNQLLYLFSFKICFSVCLSLFHLFAPSFLQYVHLFYDIQ